MPCGPARSDSPLIRFPTEVPYKSDQSDQCRFFWFAPPEGRSVGVERLVAIGATAVEKALDHLHMDRKHDFASVLDPARRGIVDDEDDYPPPELWTSARASLRVHRR